MFVIDFKGDLAATEVRSLREEISAILSLAGPQDETILRLESPGGTVHGYGLAASQLLRLRTGGVPLTICVDKVAASGGYLMACTADRLIAAPFAVIGSIGVLVQMPNFHRILKKNEVDFEMISAGEYKRTLSLFGEVTAKGRNKARQDVEEVHKLFKSWVKDNRPSLDVDSVSTGEIWLGVQARQQGMVDDLGTSDEYIVNACDDADVFEVEYEVRKSIQEKLAHTVDACASRLLSLFVERSRPENHWS